MLDELEFGLRRVVADEIGDYLNRATDEGRRVPDELDQRQMARAILRRELDNRSKAALRLGESPLTADDEDVLLERVLATAFSAAPLYISLIVGLFTSLVSVALILYAIATKLMGIAAEGAPGILIAVAFFSGIILITNGLMGIYIAKIYYDVKQRPRYLIREIIPAGDAPPPTK